MKKKVNKQVQGKRTPEELKALLAANAKRVQRKAAASKESTELNQDERDFFKRQVIDLVQSVWETFLPDEQWIKLSDDLGPMSPSCRKALEDNLRLAGSAKSRGYFYVGRPVFNLPKFERL